jgi:hypothetical protein
MFPEAYIDTGIVYAELDMDKHFTALNSEIDSIKFVKNVLACKPAEIKSAYDCLCQFQSSRPDLDAIQAHNLKYQIKLLSEFVLGS